MASRPQRFSESPYFIPVLIAAGLAVVGILLYANTLPNKMFWDDYETILNNQFVHDWRHFPDFFSQNLTAGAGDASNYWRPMLLVVFAAEWHLWGAAPAGYHVVNTACHILGAILLFFLLREIFESIPLAAIPSLIFLTHPLQTEAVTYVSGLGDPLSACFMLAAFITYERARRKGRPFASPWYWTSLAGYALAIMAKETAIVLAALIAARELLLPQAADDPWKRRAQNAAIYTPPFFSIAAAYLALRATALNFQGAFNFYGADTPFTHYSYRIFTFFESLAVYAKLFFVPYPLHVERDIPVAITLFAPLPIAGAFIFAFLAAAAFACARRHPAVTFGIAWFFIALSPMSNLAVTINALIYEHWLYLPMVGIALALSALALELVSRRPALAVPALTTFGVLIVAASALTVARNRDWRNPIAFYAQTLRYVPPNYRILINLGLAYADNGDFARAKSSYEDAAHIEPYTPTAFQDLGALGLASGKPQDAVNNLETAITLDQKNPAPYLILAEAYLAEKDPVDARKALEDSLRYAGAKPETLFALASIAETQNDATAARIYLEEALRLDPGNTDARDAFAHLKPEP